MKNLKLKELIQIMEKRLKSVSQALEMLNTMGIADCEYNVSYIESKDEGLKYEQKVLESLLNHLEILKIIGTFLNVKVQEEHTKMSTCTTNIDFKLNHLGTDFDNAVKVYKWWKKEHRGDWEEDER